MSFVIIYAIIVVDIRVNVVNKQTDTWEIAQSVQLSFKS